MVLWLLALFHCCFLYSTRGFSGKGKNNVPFRKKLRNRKSGLLKQVAFP